jgi:hypothetical protein
MVLSLFYKKTVESIKLLTKQAKIGLKHGGQLFILLLKNGSQSVLERGKNSKITLFLPIPVKF